MIIRTINKIRNNITLFLCILTACFPIGCNQPETRANSNTYDIPPKYENTWSLKIESIRNISEGSIEIHEIDGENILVLLVDGYGDGHIFVVDYNGYSKQEAIRIIKEKQMLSQKNI
ncbi:MAG: hypothetical protein ABIC68_00540 [Candidatus Omnitrophota bacterium]